MPTEPLQARLLGRNVDDAFDYPPRALTLGYRSLVDA